MPTLSPANVTAATSGKENSSGVSTDWWVMITPAVLSLRIYDMRASIGVLTLIVIAMFAQNKPIAQKLVPWPYVLWLAAAGVVLLNPEPGSGALRALTAAGLVAVIALWTVVTVGARTVISALIDGIGLYLLINVLAYLAGMRSPGAADRIGAVNESTGFVRIIYPLSLALDEPAALASVFIVAIPFLLWSEKRRRLFRVACLLAAIAVAFTAASRTSVFIAASLPILGLLLPATLRWMAPISALFASISALVLPDITKASEAFLTPVLTALTPGRDTRVGDIASLSNRDLIWSRSVKFWLDHVHKVHDQFLGFGQTGQFRSGVSVSYAELLSNATRYPRRGSLHNSFLQQLFDGGLIGWMLLTIALVWAAIRFSHHLRDWGAHGKAAVLALTALLLNGTVGIALSPGFLLATFLVATILIAISCQVPESSSASPANENVVAESRPAATASPAISRVSLHKPDPAHLDAIN